MLHHFVIIYDTKNHEWSVESDSSAHFEEGKSIWDDVNMEWIYPELNSDEDILDYRLYHTLEESMKIIPAKDDILAFPTAPSPDPWW